MSLSFFRIERGLELDDSVQYLQGTGVPGAAGDTSLAPVGSVYTDNTDGSLWTKIAAGVGTNRWQRMASETYVNNAMGATVSWREPVVVRDNVATTLPTGTPTSPIIVDGVSITDGQRVLFSALTGGAGKNIYVYNQTTGVFAEDLNQESSGDSTYVSGGTSAGRTYVYNGTNWVQSDQTSLDEEGFIRAFIGKGATGSELPDYSSNNFVVDSSSLETAIGRLDQQLGLNVSLGNYVSPANTLNANIQALDTALGANVLAGNHISPANSVNANISALDLQVGPELLVGNHYAANTVLSSAIQALDNQLGPDVVNGSFVLAANTTHQNIQALDSAIGASVTNVGVILSTNSVNQNIQALGNELSATAQQTSVTNVTSVQTIDSVAAGAAKWLVRVELAANPADVYATEVYAVSNGSTVDFTRYGTLRLGTNIPGLVVSADLNAGSIRLRVASTGAVNVEARRVGTVI